ncbi:winged helix-turn-helix domain-containing protein [Telmatobacter sp. DSM 110680]|uniref:Winged helix-turn-helix domain-containing protein n=1 Tax=Telmatobacter sp. DSM 110680 TaxID=3036704 RepID=A0AAU7DDJ4_9BACT
MTANKLFVFRFGDLEVRESEYSVVRQGKILAIEPKAFRVLLLLLRNPQRVVSKEELLKAIWGDAAVTENSVARSVLKLRKALDDDVREPRYIETVATVGYRLICHVDASEEPDGLLGASPNGTRIIQPANENIDPAKLGIEVPPALQESVEPVDSPSQASTTPEATNQRRNPLLWLFFGIAIAGVMVYEGWNLRRPLPPPHISSYTQLTHDNRRKGLFAIDASRLYLSFYPDPRFIGQLSTSGGPIVKIPTSIGYPMVIDASPHSARILILSRYLPGPDDSQPSLWSVDPVANVQQVLASGSVISAAWSPDARSVVYSRRNGDIEIVAADGTDRHKIAHVAMSSNHAMMDRISWSPDGRLIRFDNDDRIYEMGADGSGLRQFLPGWRTGSMMCCGRWTADGSFFLFLEWQKPARFYPLFAPSQVWAMDERRGFLRRSSKEPAQLTTGPMRWGEPMPSTDGKQIFERGVTLNGQLERASPRTHQLELLFGGISAEFVDFSPDGRSVAWVTYPEGILWRANRDGSDPIRLTNPPFYPTQTRWSPDGSKILVFGRDAHDLDKVYLISPRGGVPQPLFADDPDEQLNPSWSPDGKKIAMSWFYSSGKEPLSEIKIYDLATHHITTVPDSKDFDNARWSPDGQWLSGINIYTTELFVFNFKTQRWKSVQKGDNDYPIWSHHGGYLYFLHGSANTGIFRVKPAVGVVEQVVDLKDFRFASYYNGWIGLDLDDAPMVLRDVGGDDIYALRFEPDSVQSR